MVRPQTTSNPFYVVLLVVGLVFVLTACSYFVMTLQAREASYGRSLPPRDNMPESNMPESRDASAQSTDFADFMDQYGFTLLMVELGLLAAATFAAIGTDEYWMRRSQAEERTQPATRDLSEEEAGAQSQPARETSNATTTSSEELSDESEPSRSD